MALVQGSLKRAFLVKTTPYEKTLLGPLSVSCTADALVCIGAAWKQSPQQLDLGHIKEIA